MHVVFVQTVKRRPTLIEFKVVSFHNFMKYAKISHVPMEQSFSIKKQRKLFRSLNSKQIPYFLGKLIFFAALTCISGCLCKQS